MTYELHCAYSLHLHSGTYVTEQSEVAAMTRQSVQVISQNSTSQRGPISARVTGSARRREDTDIEIFLIQITIQNQGATRG